VSKIDLNFFHPAPVSLRQEARRLRLLDELLAQSRLTMRRDMPDAFSHFKSLDDFDLHAGDGHFIAAACHDAPKSRGSSAASPTDPTTRVAMTKYATGHLYTLDLRSHAMSHLSVADQIERLTQRTVKFIRWLKNHLDLQRDWDDAIARQPQIHSRM